MTPTTKQATHTPGPWRAQFVNTRYGWSIEIDGTGRSGSVAMIDGMRDERQEANALLIAAAPELFTELEMAHRHIGHLLQMLNGDRRKEMKEIDAIADRVPQRMAAIQKARGAQ